MANAATCPMQEPQVQCMKTRWKSYSEDMTQKIQQSSASGKKDFARCQGLPREDPALWQSCVVSSRVDWACLTSCVFEEACGKRGLWICFLKERYSVSKKMLHSFCGDCSPFKTTISKGWDCGSPNFPIWGFISAALIILEKVFIRHSLCTGRISLAARSRKGSRYKILWFQCPSSSQEDLMKSPRFTIWNSYCTDRYG